MGFPIQYGGTGTHTVKLEHNNDILIWKSIFIHRQPLAWGMERTSIQGRPHVDLPDTFYTVCLQRLNRPWHVSCKKASVVSTTAVFKGHQHPIVNSFLTRHLLLWMPRKLWNVKLHSKCNDCGKHPVTSAGVYPHVRQVLDGWEVPEDVGHRKQFLSLPTTTPGTWEWWDRWDGLVLELA